MNQLMKRNLRGVMKDPDRAVGTGCFLLYLYFILDFFLRFSARFSGYGRLRPTVLVFLIICGVLFINRENLKKRFDDPILKCALLLIGFIAVSLPLVEYPGSVVRNNLNNFVLAICFLFFTALIVDTDRRLRWFLFVFVGCQLVRILEPLYMNLTQGYWGGQTHLQGGVFADRLSGAPADVINANELGFVIVTVIPFIHYLLFPLGWKSKILYAGLMLAMLYALMLTMSRGALIALLVVVFMLFKESRHKLMLLGVAVTLAVVGWSLMTPVQQDRYISLIDRDTTGGASVDGRFMGMQAEFRLAMRRPIVGFGVGTTPEAKVNVMGYRQASHSLYAELLTEVGVIGMGIFLALLWQVYKRLIENRRRFRALHVAKDDLYTRLNTAMIATFWMYLVYSINYWGLSQYYWYLFAGLAVSFGRLLRLEDEKRQRLAAENEAPDQVESLKPRFPLAQRKAFKNP
ncbi:MAG: hypothetical protein EA349_15040 [Halomonadaceae bacterium]|nr:MAG: hypothetical protein EA349_15040 [Halomonadaceae bacterium]